MANVHQKNKLKLIQRLSWGKGSRGVYECECGDIREYFVHNVNSGNSKSCGCSGRKHGMSFSKKTHPLYNIWRGIKSRCYNPDVLAYERYGAKGVTMCDKWEKDFTSFYDWCMSNGWQRGLQIDKDIIPKRMGVAAILYSPDMCSIVTPIENQNSRKNNIVVLYDGLEYNVSQLCSKLGIRYGSFWYRYNKLGWTVTECVKSLAQIP